MRYTEKEDPLIFMLVCFLMFLVVFQPCELEPTANKHKFMVQALYIPDGDVNLDEIVSFIC